MRKLAWLVPVVLLVAGAAVAQIAINQTPAVTIACTGGGSSATTVNGGKYLFTVTGGDIFLCRDDTAATCATGGVAFPAGTVMMLDVQGGTTKSYACRSTATAFAQWTVRY